MKVIFIIVSLILPLYAVPLPVGFARDRDVGRQMADPPQSDAEFIFKMNSNLAGAGDMCDVYTDALKTMDLDDTNVRSIATNVDSLVVMANNYCGAVQEHWKPGEWQPIMKTAITPFLDRLPLTVEELVKRHLDPDPTTSKLRQDLDTVAQCGDQVGIDTLRLKSSRPQ